MVLTRSEMEIMDVLWNAGKPMSRSDILDCSADKSWKDSSVHILLNGLLRKSMIQEAGFVKRSKTYGRTFLPTVSREEFFAANAFAYKYKPSAAALVDAICRSNQLSKQELLEIREVLERHIAE